MKPFLMLAAVATSALLLIPTVATAQTVTTAIVSHQDLNLGAAADRGKLHARLDRAIGRLCAEPGMRGVGRLSMERACAASEARVGSGARAASEARVASEVTVLPVVCRLSCGEGAGMGMAGVAFAATLIGLGV